MDSQKLDMYMIANQKYFPSDKLALVKEKLANISDDRYLMVTSVELKDPTTMLLISFFLGTLGVDRFMLGETGMGILKLLTAGLCGILTIIDWFTISKKTKELNFQRLMMSI